MACCILIDIRSILCKNRIFGILAIIFARFGFCEVSTCLEISIWNMINTFSRLCQTPSSSFISIGTLCPTSQPKIGQSHFSAFMAWKVIYKPQIWYTHLYSECLDLYWFSSWLCNLWPSGGQKHSEEGVSRVPSQRTVFRTFFNMLWDINLKHGIYI